MSFIATYLVITFTVYTVMLFAFEACKLIFVWNDFWIGLYYDKDKEILYLFMLPMIGLKINFRK